MWIKQKDKQGTIMAPTVFRKVKWQISILLALFVMVLSGCAAVGPDYVQIDPQAPDAWHTQLQGGLIAGQSDPAELTRWWTVLQDPQLSALEERAIAGNLDLQEAESRIREARARRGISRASFFPTLDAGASAIKSRSSENNGTGAERELYAAGFDASWELDVFGGVKRSVEAAQANLQAAREDLHDLQVTLQAEVALNYIDVRTFQARLEVNRKNIKAQEESHALNRSLFQAGIIGDLAVQESLRTLESSRSLIPTLEMGLNAAQNRLALLLGERPGSLHAEMSTPRPLPMLPITLAVGIPAETLRRRPDIRSAERNLAAQKALVGVATADLYPKLRLSGTLGLESLSAGALFQSASRTWGVGPRLSWVLFDAGAVRRNIEVQNRRQEQALIQYERSILRAQEEVENSLFAYAKEQLRRDSLAKAAVAAEHAEAIARNQYQAGLVDFNNVLDAQRSQLILRDDLVRSNGVVIANLVRLYKALGGGWLSMVAEE